MDWINGLPGRSIVVHAILEGGGVRRWVAFGGLWLAKTPPRQKHPNPPPPKARQLLDNPSSPLSNGLDRDLDGWIGHPISNG